MDRLARKIAHVVWGCLLGLAALLLAPSARADSLACNGRIVSTGDSRYEVRAVCGEPDDVVQRVEYRTVRGRVVTDCSNDGKRVRCEHTREQVVEVTIEEWTYDFGRNRFIQYLTFEQGKLLAVRSGSYGHKK